MSPMDQSKNAAAVGKLSLMMFLQFFIWGAWYVTAPNFLGTIGFTGKDFGWTYSVGPIAGMISPFFIGMVADRFFPAQRVYGVMHLLGGAIMLGATTLMESAEASPSAINWVFFGYMLTFYPTQLIVRPATIHPIVPKTLILGNCFSASSMFRRATELESARVG